MIIEKNGRVRLTQRELDLLCENAALNDKDVVVVTTIEELLSAIRDSIQPWMGPELLRYLERRGVHPDDPWMSPEPTETDQEPMTPQEELERVAAHWLLEQNEPDFSPDQQARLQSWLDASDENRETYMSVKRARDWTLRLFGPHGPEF